MLAENLIEADILLNICKLYLLLINLADSDNKHLQPIQKSGVQLKPQCTAFHKNKVQKILKMSSNSTKMRSR